MSERICNNCKAWGDKPKSTTSPDGDWNKCHRHAPRPCGPTSAPADEYAYFRRTHWSSWCLEWVPRDGKN